MLSPKGQLFLSRAILDGIFGSYEPIYDENYHQFAPDYETLAEGDNFWVGEPTYLHCFFEADPKAELDALTFQILDSSVKRE